VLKAGSPKTNKSRLAPLDVQLNEKKANEKEKGSSLESGRKRNESMSKETNETNQEDPEMLLNWKTQIEPQLNQLDIYFKEAQIDQFCDACDSLNQLLDRNQMYSKSFAKRAVILKIIFKYLDTDSDKMRIKVLKIILNVKQFLIIFLAFLYLLEVFS
jgi:archaellum component FlaC